MKLVFRKRIKSIQEVRKSKLLSLGQKEKRESIGFDWELTPENREEDEERIKNLHLFCTSIVLDLLKNQFETNENGIKTYEKNKENKLVIKKIQNLFTIIANDNKK